MQISPNKLNSPNSTVQSQSETPTVREFHLKTEKRFSRSKSSSRSKSKQRFKGSQLGNFYVKNICLDIITDKPEAQIILTNFSLNSQSYQPKTKRSGTPAKQKSLVKKQVQKIDNLECSLQKQLCWLKMEKQLKQTISMKENLQLINKKLEEKIRVLSLQLEEVNNQKNFLSAKIQHIELKEFRGREGRINNAAKIKQLIIDNKNYEGPPLEGMQQKLKKLMSDNKNYQERLSQTQAKLKEFQIKNSSLKSEHETYLEELVQKLKVELNMKVDIIQKMQIQLNIFLVRQSKNEEIKLSKGNEQIENIKKKYISCLKKYHQVNQELAAYKRKQDRMSVLFSNSSKFRKDRSGSLSISP